MTSALTSLPELQTDSAEDPVIAAVDSSTTLSVSDRLLLFAPVDALPLACFRIFFGLVMLYHVSSYLIYGGVRSFYITPEFHFTYPGFGWVRPLSGAGMYVLFGVMGAAVVGILLGCLYRVSAVVFALTFTWVFLLEKALYQNHYYLICLLGSIMVFVPADRMWSVDSLLSPAKRSQTAPCIWLWLLRAQIAIPYLYGGFAKINPDWLHGMPVRMWLERRSWLPWVGPWLGHDACVMFFAWGGLLFDLLIVPAFFVPRLRVPAYVCAVVFHLTNSLLWDIGIFPWFMIGATVLFFPADTIRRSLFRRPLRRVSQAAPTDSEQTRQRATVCVAAVYLVWQLVFPFRHFLYPGDASWTEEAHHFAWHMMLREKDVGIRIQVHHPGTGEVQQLPLQEFLSQRQIRRVGKDPDMILEFVHFIRERYRRAGEPDVQIRVLTLASLNGRRPQLLIDPTIDYAGTKRVLTGHQSWIVPLSEPLRRQAWDRPLDQWESELSHLIPQDMRRNRGK